MRFLPLLILGFVVSSPASALVIRYANVGDEIAGNPGITYFDLLKEVVPDLTLEANGAARGGSPIAFKNIVDPTCPCNPPEAVYIEGVDAQPFRSAGRDRLLLLAHLSSEGWSVGGTTLLMLFDLDASPRLVDLTDVALDMEVSFSDPPLLDLSADDQAALINSRHWNSNQDYRSTIMIFALAGKLTLIDDVFTFSDRGCSYQQVQSPSFEAVPAPDRPLADIRVRIKAELYLTGEADCGGDLVEPSLKTVEVTYRWDADARSFLPDSNAVEVLSKENEARF